MAEYPKILVITKWKRNILYCLKMFFFIQIVIWSIPIWFPIVVWKMGLIISDNFINYLIDD